MSSLKPPKRVAFPECEDLFKVAEYHSTHVNQESMKAIGLPQVAFLGRSNAGKSSLINAILNRKSLVKVSANPGKTRTINLFTVSDQLILTDLPGFGYAKVSKAERAKMFAMILDYIHNRQLKMLFVLCDSARKLPDEEKELLNFCYLNSIQPALVWTKTDSLKKDERNELKKESSAIRELFPNLNIIHSSAKKRLGIKEIHHLICEVLLT